MSEETNTTNITNIQDNPTARLLKNVQHYTEKFTQVKFASARAHKDEKAFMRSAKDYLTVYNILPGADVDDPENQLDSFLADTVTQHRNYQTVLGPVSIPDDPTPHIMKSLFVIDLDVNHENQTSSGIDNFKEHLAQYFASSPKTFSVRTKSGGLHLYYYVPTQLIRDLSAPKTVAFIDGVDLLSSTADEVKEYTLVGPGSFSTNKVHTSYGRSRYAIEADENIQPLPQPFVEHLKTVLTTKRKDRELFLSESKVRAQANGEEEDSASSLRDAKSYITDLVMEAKEYQRNNGGECLHKGNRNNALNTFAFKLASFGLSDGVFKSLAVLINEDVFASPLSDEEFEITIKSARDARITSGESFANASPDLPEILPYPNSDITYDELINYAQHLDYIRENNLYNTEAGIKIITRCTFVAGMNSYYKAFFSPPKTIIPKIQKNAEEINTFTYSSLSAQLRKLEIEFERYPTNGYDIHFPTISWGLDEDQTKKKGRPAARKLTTHPIFQQGVKRGIRISISTPKDHVVKDGKFYTLSPPPMSFLPKISDEEYARQLPFIKEILQHFKETVTNPNEPKEFEYLENYIAAMYQNKPAQSLIVLYGPQGTGKSQFLKFMSLFVSNHDWLEAENVNRLFKDHTEVGRLTTVDDTNLNRVKEKDALKAMVTNDTHVLERKYEQAIRVNKQVSVVAATNHKITDTDFLSGRRLVWLESPVKYTPEEYIDIVDTQCRKLISNNAVGLAALHRYFQTFDVKISDWQFRSKAHLNLLKEIRMVQRTSSIKEDETDKLSYELAQRDADAHKLEEAAIVNLIANLGFVNNSLRVPLVTPLHRLQEYKNYPHFVNNSIDWCAVLKKFERMSEPEKRPLSPMEMNKLFLQKENAVSGITAQFTAAINKKSSCLGIIANTHFSPVQKKVTPKIKHLIKSKSVKRGRIMVLPPIVDWIDRLSVLENDTLSTEVSRQFVESRGLFKITEAIKALTEEPTEDECKAIFNEAFPDEEFGKFNLIGTVYQEQLNEFLDEDDDELDDSVHDDSEFGSEFKTEDT